MGATASGSTAMAATATAWAAGSTSTAATAMAATATAATAAATTTAGAMGAPKCVPDIGNFIKESAGDTGRGSIYLWPAAAADGFVGIGGSGKGDPAAAATASARRAPWAAASTAGV